MIVVTGGAGFIGSNIVAALVERGEAVVVDDRLRDGSKWLNLRKHELSDLIHPDSLTDFLAGTGPGEVEALVHMGAISATTETDADRVIENNFQLSLELWHWCADREVPFIYASSAATYGDGRQGFSDEASPEHLATLRPLNPYGWSKHLFDRRVARAVESGEPTPPQWVGLKFFNVFGPNEYHKGAMRSVVHQTWERIMKGEPARLFRSHRPDYEDGGQLRDFVWVGDCVDLTLWFLDNPEVSGLFNCGTGEARSFLDLVHAVYRAMGREPEIDWVDTPEEIRDRYQYFTEAEMRKVRGAGYPRDFLTLEDGVERYVKDFLEQEDPHR